MGKSVIALVLAVKLQLQQRIWTKLVLSCRGQQKHRREVSVISSADSQQFLFLFQHVEQDRAHKREDSTFLSTKWKKRQWFPFEKTQHFLCYRKGHRPDHRKSTYGYENSVFVCVCVLFTIAVTDFSFEQRWFLGPKSGKVICGNELLWHFYFTPTSTKMFSVTPSFAFSIRPFGFITGPRTVLLFFLTIFY